MCVAICFSFLELQCNEGKNTPLFVLQRTNFHVSIKRLKCPVIICVYEVV